MPIVKTHRIGKENIHWICNSFLLQRVYYENINDTKKTHKPQQQNQNNKKEKSMFALIYATE